MADMLVVDTVELVLTEQVDTVEQVGQVDTVQVMVVEEMTGDVEDTNIANTKQKLHLTCQTGMGRMTD